jgi:hypothetical protein
MHPHFDGEKREKGSHSDHAWQSRVFLGEEIREAWVIQ